MILLAQIFINLSWLLFIIYSLTCHSIGFHPKFDLIHSIVLVLLAASWRPYILVVHVLLVWPWTILCPWDHQYTLGSSFDSYLFLLTSDFYWVVFPMFPFPCLIKLSMLAFSDLLNYVNAFLEEINWATASLYEKSTSARLSSTEKKSIFSSAWLNSACVEFKRWSYLNSLYSNAKNVLKVAHVFYALGFQRQSLQAYLYIPDDLTVWYAICRTCAGLYSVFASLSHRTP